RRAYLARLHVEPGLRQGRGVGREGAGNPDSNADAPRAWRRVPEALRGVTWSDWVADAELALQALLTGVEQAVLFGHSMGRNGSSGSRRRSTRCSGTASVEAASAAVASWVQRRIEDRQP
ncbi:MAG: hypothetical protein U9R72_02255, partial [Chloroflexota bacterium]|nr:hypothetical protein [Chloroflexota bacterium]